MPAPYDYSSSTGYARTRADWADFPTTSTPITQAQLDQFDQAIRDLKYLTYNVKDYGVIGDGTTDDTTAINSALTAATTNGGIVFFPQGRYKTNGGHVIPVGVTVQGVRRGISGDGTANGTSFRHRGSTYCFKLTDETSGGAGCGLQDVSIYGSSGTDAAVAGGIGVEIGNGQKMNLERVLIYGFTSTGVGLRFHNTTGTVLYCEHNHVRAVTAVNCAKCVQFLTDGGGSGTSFGYNQLFDIHVQPYASQIGFDFSGATNFYNSRIFGQMHYAGNNAIGINVNSPASVYQGSYVDIAGELLGSLTGCVRVKVAAGGVFYALGRFFVANGQPPDSVSGGFDFHELDSDTAALSTRDIASAAAITVPGGSDFWNVTGTTTITSVAGSWEGRTVTLKFAGILTFTDGSNLKLAGNFVTTADDTITLIHRSGTWYEVARSVN